MTQTFAPPQLGAVVPPVSPTISTRAFDAPTVPAVLLAIGGLGIFGICTGLGAGALTATTIAALIPVAAIVGSMVLTGPALVAGQLFLRPGVKAEMPVTALGKGLTAAGSLAAGIAPLALFLVATTGLWPAVLLAGLAAFGITCAVVTVRALVGGPDSAGGFVALWMMLTTAVSLRIAYGMGSLTLEALR